IRDRNVTVVQTCALPILNVDSLLSYPDFRLNERAFQILSQVSGRSGRRGEGGKVLLQTMNTDHPVFEYVLQHDYEGFYEAEIKRSEERRVGKGWGEKSET